MHITTLNDFEYLFSFSHEEIDTLSVDEPEQCFDVLYDALAQKLFGTELCQECIDNEVATSFELFYSENNDDKCAGFLFIEPSAADYRLIKYLNILKSEDESAVYQINKPAIDLAFDALEISRSIFEEDDEMDAHNERCEQIFQNLKSQISNPDDSTKSTDKSCFIASNLDVLLAVLDFIESDIYKYKDNYYFESKNYSTLPEFCEHTNPDYFAFISEHGKKFCPLSDLDKLKILLK